ncbi:unnamed protein product, partial [Heterosigma akashiwo]
HPIFTLSFLCVAVAVVTTFAPPPVGVNTGRDPECVGHEGSLAVCICPRSTVCAKNLSSVVFLVLARASAYFDYPLYVALFLSKAHNLHEFLQRTYVSEFVNFKDLHHLHTLAGTVVAFEVIWHSFFHLLRWSLSGDIYLLWQHVTGQSGLIALALTPLITAPMMSQGLRKVCSFEWRKLLHYLSVVWGLVICFHAPTQHIGMIMGSALGVYLADYIYGFFAKLHYIPTLNMRRLAGAVAVQFENPDPSFGRGGYVYICLPWVSKYQFHAFSLVKLTESPGHSSVCMAAVGDWTKAVHMSLKRPSSRPAWIYGPFPSPFGAASNFDNLICVASGIGITPALSIVTSWSQTRRVNLIWMCRDPDLIEHYLHNIYDDDAWSFIFYTGKRELNFDDTSIKLLKQRPSIKIMQGRPNEHTNTDLEDLVCAIIDNISNDEGLPGVLPAELLNRSEEFMHKIFNSSPMARFLTHLETMLATYSPSELYDQAVEPSRGISHHHYDGDELSAVEMGVCNRHGITFAGFVNLFFSHGFDVPKKEQLKEHFSSVDLNGDGVIDRNEFASLCFSISHHKPQTQIPAHSPTFRRPIPQKGCVFGSTRRPHQRDHKKSVQDMAPEVKDTWQMMYCGGSKPVLTKLKKIRDKHRIKLEVESFDW